MKTCSKCKNQKAFDQFNKRSKSPDGYRSQCRSCERAYDKQRYHDNIDESREKARKKENKFRTQNPSIIKERAKKTYIKNKEIIKQRVKSYQQANKEKVREWQKQFRLKNKDKVSIWSKNYKNQNKDKINERRRIKRTERRLLIPKKPKIDQVTRSRIWRQNNKEKYLEVAKKAKQKQLLNNPLYRPLLAMSQGMRYALKNVGGKKNKSWTKLVDYSVEQLINHLESKFTTGMTWENYGRNGWHIDHIIPQHYFKYDSFEHPAFKACWSLSNLQPLWETTEVAISYGESPNYIGNINKGKKIIITENIQRLLDSVNI